MTVSLHQPGGSATPGEDYSIPPGSVTIAASESSATFSITTKDDALTESQQGNAAAGETVQFVVAQSGSYTIGAGVATATIADDSAWFYTQWVEDERPMAWPDVSLDEYTYDSPSGGYVERYTQKYEWVPLGTQFTDVSDDFGVQASFSGYIEFGESKSWGYNVGGEFDLKNFIKVPVTISGQYSREWSKTTTSGAQVNRTKAGNSDMLYQIAGYVLRSYVETRRTHFHYEQIYDPATGTHDTIRVYDYPSETFRNDLGYTGEKSTQYLVSMRRIWADNELGGAQGYAKTYVFPSPPPTIPAG